MTYLQNEQIEVYASQTAKDGKAYCGDSYFFKATDEYFVCVLADGLGSGKYAHESSSAVTEVVAAEHQKPVEELMRLCNQVLHHKRGAAVAVLKVFFDKKEFEYSCVGNIRFYLYNQAEKLTYPLPVTGYLNGRPQVYRTRSFPFERNSRFLLHSDGINVSNAKALLRHRSLEEITAELQQQSTQSKDDATFIIGSLL